MIKAIIFDFYGVLRSDDYHDWLDRHGMKYEGKLKDLSRDSDMGVTSVDQFFESLSKLSSVPAKEIRQEFLSYGSLNRQLIELILKLKKNYKIAILSNASSSHIINILKNAGADVLFDEIVISSDIGYIKPSTEIFNHALNKLGVTAAEAVFIDDSQRFCQAAEQLGIKSICFNGAKSLISDLKEIGIIDS